MISGSERTQVPGVIRLDADVAVDLRGHGMWWPLRALRVSGENASHLLN